MIITIDGPAKSGKSKASELLAKSTGYRYLNTGAMYRAAGLLFRELNWLQKLGDNSFIQSVENFVQDFAFNMNDRVILNGRDFTDFVHTPDAGEAASLIGQYEFIRKKLKEEQKRIARDGQIICEGRDQGTSVFPEAPLKFFITASPAVRAQRMAMSMSGSPDLTILEKQIAERDHRDSTRQFDPLKPAPDAMLIDTSILSAEAVAEQMMEAFRKCQHSLKV